MVFLPRLTSSPQACASARQINADCWASSQQTLQPVKTILLVSNGVLSTALATFATAVLLGCTQTDTALYQAALALNNASIACVEEVKLLKLKYEVSPRCLALEPLAQNYADLGGLTAQTPNKYEPVYERARVYAWMARAISASGDPNLWIFRLH